MKIEFDPALTENLEVFSNPAAKDALILDKQILLDNVTTEHLLEPVYRPRFYNNYLPREESTNIYLQSFTPAMNIGAEELSDIARKEKVKKPVTSINNLYVDKNGVSLKKAVGDRQYANVFRMDERDEGIPYSRKVKDGLIRNHRSLYPFKVSNAAPGYNIPEVDKRENLWNADEKAQVSLLKKPILRDPRYFKEATHTVGRANYREPLPPKRDEIKSSESKELFDRNVTNVRELFDPAVEPNQLNSKNYRYNAEPNQPTARSDVNNRSVDGGLIEYGGQKYQNSNAGSTFMKKQVGFDDHVAFYTNSFTPVVSNLYTSEELPDVKDFYDTVRKPDGSTEQRFLSVDMNNLAEPYRSEFLKNHDGISKVRNVYDATEMFKIPAFFSAPSQVNRLKFTDPNGREIFDYIPEVPYEQIRKGMSNQYMTDKQFVHDAQIASAIRKQNMEGWQGEIFDSF